MKKNIAMRLASGLMLSCLLSTCVISGTFAKYTTTASGSDEARVAKWGFNTTTLTVNMFDGEYTNVKSGNATNVVAPGTEKTATITLIPSTQTGTPEVAYSFNVNVSSTGSTDALLNKLVWSLDGEICGENGTFAELQADINTKFDKDHEAGALPESSFSVTWSWPYDVDADGNVSDTTLGNEGTAEVIITFDFTATQKD